MPVENAEGVVEGDLVALHWDYVCQVLSPTQLEHLIRYHDHHMEIANKGSNLFAGIIEG